MSCGPRNSRHGGRGGRNGKGYSNRNGDMDANRAKLTNMRVVQRNLFYVIGLSPKLADEGVLRSDEFFGQYGKIASEQ